MVDDSSNIRRALSAEVLVHEPAELEAYRSQFLGLPASSPEKTPEAHPLLIPMVYPFQTNASDEQIEDHIIQTLTSIKKFKVLLRGITGYPGGFVLLNVKAGNDRLILIHDLLHQGLLKPALNPLYTFFPHVLLFRCKTPELMRDAVVKGQELQRAFEGTVEAIRIEHLGEDGAMTLSSAIELE